MKILLFGGTGQLGREIVQKAEGLHLECVYPVSSELDVSERDEVVRLATASTPDIIINTAAYTAVDRAEEESERCFAINARGAAHVAEAAKESGAALIHISTDYVYGNKATEPIKEDFSPEPLNVYGRSKLEGDNAVLDILRSRATIMRVSSLHGQYGHNFVHTMLRLFEEKELVKVVQDQVMSPTWTGWLAEVVLDIARTDTDTSGIVHAASAGEISWFDFAREIYQLAAPQSKDEGWKAKLEPTTSESYVTAATRPRYSVLDTTKLEHILGRDVITWQDGLTHHLKDIGRYAL